MGQPELFFLNKSLKISIFNDINTLISDRLIYDKAIFRGINISAGLKEVLESEITSSEEIPFINRLLLESVFSEIKKIEIQLEIIHGEWIGTEKVKSHKAYVIFNGVEAFKVFHRRRTKNNSIQWIPINSRILIIVKPEKVITLDSGYKIWQFIGKNIRKLN